MPIEIISLITELLDIDDLFNLRLSCRHFGYVFQDNGLCRLAFKVFYALIRLSPIPRHSSIS